MPLEKVLPGLVTELERLGISLSRGNRALEIAVKNDEKPEKAMAAGEKHQFGIPCADLPGMSAMFQCDTSDMYLCVFYETYNDENVLKFFERFVRDMLEKPKVVDHTGAQPTQ
jgi:hypothetical protein